jgi:hypothetical protein
MNCTFTMEYLRRKLNLPGPITEISVRLLPGEDTQLVLTTKDKK